MYSKNVNIHIIILEGEFISGFSRWPEPVQKKIYDNWKDNAARKWYTIGFPTCMDEFQVKAHLRDRGFISCRKKEYFETRIFFSKAFDEEFIEFASPKSNITRTLEMLEAQDNESILIVFAAQEKTPISDSDVYYGP